MDVVINTVPIDNLAPFTFLTKFGWGTDKSLVNWRTAYTQRLHNIMIMSILRKNGVITSFWRNNDVIHYVISPLGYDRLRQWSTCLSWQIKISSIAKVNLKNIPNFVLALCLLMIWHRSEPGHLQAQRWPSSDLVYVYKYIYIYMPTWLECEMVYFFSKYSPIF